MAHIGICISSISGLVPQAASAEAAPVQDTAVQAASLAEDGCGVARTHM